MKKIMWAPWEDGQPVMPPEVDHDGGIQMHYTDDHGIVHGGWSLVDAGPTDIGGGKWIRVEVDADRITINQMLFSGPWTLAIG